MAGLTKALQDHASFIAHLDEGESLHDVPAQAAHIGDDDLSDLTGIDQYLELVVTRTINDSTRHDVFVNHVDVLPLDAVALDDQGVCLVLVVR